MLAAAEFQLDAEGTPLLRLTGRAMTSAPGTSTGGRVVAMFKQQGKTFEGEVVSPPVGVGPDGLEQMIVKVPRTVIAGIAEISLVRVDSVFGLDPCTGQFGPVEKAYESNSLKLSDTGQLGDYVVSALMGPGAVAVMTQGDPSAEHPEAALKFVAQIPVGSNPKSTALTADHTRAYVTLRNDGAVAVVDLVAMQKADALPGNAPSKDDPDPVDNSALPAGAKPFRIVIDDANRYAYVSDEENFGVGTGKIYVIDVDPTSTDFHHVVRTIEVDDVPVGLRDLTLSEDGRRLYVAAPNRDWFGRPEAEQSHILVVNVDEADRPVDPRVNPKKFWAQIASIETGQETYAIQHTGDPTRIAFTNRALDSEGFGVVTVTDDSVKSFSAGVSMLPLTLGSLFDTFDVNNGASVLILPEDTFKSVLGQSHRTTPTTSSTRSADSRVPAET